MIFFALKTTLAWRKFSRSVFEMAAVPAAPGGALAGGIQVPARLRPRHGWHLRLSCVRRMTTGASNNRQTTEKILWQDEKWLRADLPQTGLNVTGIPVHFQIARQSAGIKGFDRRRNSLEARSVRGIARAEFPRRIRRARFQTGRSARNCPTTRRRQYQMSLDEIRKQIHSHIQVNDLPDGGKEFCFPAARNPGFASGATIICLIWTGIIALLMWKRAPLPVLFVFGAIDLLMAAFVLDLWFRRSRVVVNPKGLTVQNAWFVFKKEQRRQAGEIKNIAADVGATAGHAHYHELKVQTRDGKEFTIAKNLNSKPEADWLVRQMIAALKPPA